MKMIISLGRCDCDVTPNSHHYPKKKSMALFRRMNILILGMKGLTNVSRPCLATDSHVFALLSDWPLWSSASNLITEITTGSRFRALAALTALNTKVM